MRGDTLTFDRGADGLWRDMIEHSPRLKVSDYPLTHATDRLEGLGFHNTPTSAEAPRDHA